MHSTAGRPGMQKTFKRSGVVPPPGPCTLDTKLVYRSSSVSQTQSAGRPAGHQSPHAVPSAALPAVSLSPASATAAAASALGPAAGAGPRTSSRMRRAGESTWGNTLNFWAWYSACLVDRADRGPRQQAGGNAGRQGVAPSRGKGQQASGADDADLRPACFACARRQRRVVNPTTSHSPLAH